MKLGGMCIVLFLAVPGCSSTKPDPVVPSAGAIAGVICDFNFGGITRANVQILNHSELWRGAGASRTGQFLMLHVPVGIYRMRGSALGYHPQEVFDVRVAPDSISIVRFGMFNAALQINPNPIQWIRTDSTLLELDKYVQSGKLFDMQCR